MNSSSVESTKLTKKKLKIKVKKSANKSETLIKNKLDDIYSNSHLSKSYLNYEK